MSTQRLERRDVSMALPSRSRSRSCGPRQRVIERPGLNSFFVASEKKERERKKRGTAKNSAN